MTSTPKSLVNPLDTPLKRLGGVIFYFGLAWLVLGMGVASAHPPHGNYYDNLGFISRSFVLLFETFTNGPNTDGKYWYLRLAGCTIILGLALSYFYDYFLGRLVSWIRGSSRTE